MLNELRRAMRAARGDTDGAFLLGRFAERAGDWVVLLTILVMAWNRTADVSMASWAVALWFVPRLVVAGLFEGWTRRIAVRTWPVLAAARAAIVVIVLAAMATRIVDGPELILGSVALLGFVAAVAGGSRTAVLKARAGLLELGAAAWVDSIVDRFALMAGGLLAGAFLMLTDPIVALIAAAALLAVAAISGFAAFRDVAGTAPLRAADPPLMEPDEARRVARSTALFLVAAFTTGALGAVLIIATLPLAVIGPNAVSTAAPLLVALAGLGMIFGPLPVPRLLLRVPPAVLLLATVVVTAAAAITIALTKSPPLVVGALIVFGVAAVTQDALRAIALRRLTPPSAYERVARLSLLALTVGQIYGAIGIVSVASLDPFSILVLLGISQVLLVGLGILIAGRAGLRIGGLSSLPIKSVVHKLSWDTRPAAEPADFSDAEPREPRVQRLAKWINRRVALEKLHVTLPVSGREYEIYRPTNESRERLFEEGRADPEKQMPYWAKVWPSGVALADVIVERKEEVAQKHVLELGAGLGVTACSVLEYGGQIVTADYSALPLAHCRLNTVVNTGRAPRTTCFNWRHDSEVKAALKQPEFSNGFPLIIAGDVLYEGRDAEPLLNVIHRMLVADGSLWLAEPVRRTAQRFLDSAALLGWEIESRQVKAEWPDATNRPVNLHFLRRSAEPDMVLADLGGMRI